jgi:hypothetical protein
MTIQEFLQYVLGQSFDRLNNKTRLVDTEGNNIEFVYTEATDTLIARSQNEVSPGRRE